MLSSTCQPAMPAYCIIHPRPEAGLPAALEQVADGSWLSPCPRSPNRRAGPAPQRRQRQRGALCRRAACLCPAQGLARARLQQPHVCRRVSALRRRVVLLRCPPRSLHSLALHAAMAEPPPSLAPGPCHAEIVPPHQRNLVYAFDRCFEGAWAAQCVGGSAAAGPSPAAAACVTRVCASRNAQLPDGAPPRRRRCAGAIAACAAPLVGVLAERIFGFSGTGTGAVWA